MQLSQITSLVYFFLILFTCIKEMFSYIRFEDLRNNSLYEISTGLTTTEYLNETNTTPTNIIGRARPPETPNVEQYVKYVLAILEFSIDDTYTLCGGSLALPDAVIFSSSCRKSAKPIDYSKLIVLSNLENRQQYSPRSYVQELISHPQYERSIYVIKNDIGILLLEDKFKLNMNRSIIPFPSSELTAAFKFDDENSDTICNLAYWPFDYVDWKDKTTELNFRVIPVLVVPRQICRKLSVPFTVAVEQFCGKTFQGEIADENVSGGPLICGHVQFAFLTKVTKGFGNESILIFTRMDFYEDYVKSVISEAKYVKSFPVKHRRGPDAAGIGDITVHLPWDVSTCSRIKIYPLYALLIGFFVIY